MRMSGRPFDCDSLMHTHGSDAQFSTPMHMSQSEIFDKFLSIAVHMSKSVGYDMRAYNRAENSAAAAHQS
jgi:hypothetical protein